MKTQVLRSSILALLIAVAGHAQSSQPLNTNIPFNFVVMGTTLPAGHYIVNQGSAGLITLQSQERKTGAFLSAPAMECTGSRTASSLIFHRYGNTYLLSEIWTGGNNCGRQAPVTILERELAAKHTAPDETIV